MAKTTANLFQLKNFKICHEGSVSKGFQETKEARDQMLSEAQMMSYYVHNHVIEVRRVQLTLEASSP